MLLLYFMPVSVCSDTYEQPARKNVCCFLLLVLKLQVYSFLKQIDDMKEKL